MCPKEETYGQTFPGETPEIATGARFSETMGCQGNTR